MTGCPQSSPFQFTFVSSVYHSCHVFCVGVGEAAVWGCHLPVLALQTGSERTLSTLFRPWLKVAALCWIRMGKDNGRRSQGQMKELNLLISCTMDP